MPRHNKRLRGRDSMLVNIEAPVVVNPDIVSKKLRVNDGISWERKNGKAPRALAPNQARVTNKKPPLTVRFPLGRAIIPRRPPEAILFSLWNRSEVFRKIN